ncbi:MAG: pyridoxal phosphate-dependent aminotransferase [Deltaproteobacteria bacterium]|nr:pyridoxal phosphate-dependent aminotransferase [Deltaproteobacteria bacterium]
MTGGHGSLAFPHGHDVFRPVPRTGVIYVMNAARELGFEYGDPSWANLGQGAPEAGVLPGAPPRLEAVSLHTTTYEYSPVLGRTDLREAVADLYNHRYRRGRASRYTAENVAIAGGGRLSLSRLAAALGQTHLGHFLPDYTAYEELLDLFARFSTIPIPLDPERGYAFSADELRTEIVGRGLGAVLLSNPSNPTGALVHGDRLAKWVATARELETFLLFDEYYSNYVWAPDAAAHGSVSAAAHVDDVDRDPIVILDGLTKNWRYPGMRIGWTLAPRRIIEAVSSVGSFLDGGAAHPLQEAAIPLLAPAVADAEAEAIRAVFREKRDYMITRLVRMGLHVDAAPMGAFYVWASVRHLPEPLRSDMGFFRAALERKVITVPGRFFDINPGQRRSEQRSRFGCHVRFSFGPERATLVRGLDALEAMIAEARAR